MPAKHPTHESEKEGLTSWPDRCVLLPPLFQTSSLMKSSGKLGCRMQCVILVDLRKRYYTDRILSCEKSFATPEISLIVDARYWALGPSAKQATALLNWGKNSYVVKLIHSLFILGIRWKLFAHVKVSVAFLAFSNWRIDEQLDNHASL